MISMALSDFGGGQNGSIACKPDKTQSGPLFQDDA